MVAWVLAKGLAEKGHTVSMIAPDGSECPGVEIIPCGPAGRVSEEMSYGGFPEIKQKQGDKEVVLRERHLGYWQHLLEVDVVIDHSWSKFSYQLKMEGRLKAPVLGVLHAPVKTMYQSPPPVEKPCLVCISEDQAEACRNLLECDCRVARHGLDLDFYQNTGVPRTSRFLFLARFSTIKGPDLAIKACRQAQVGLDLVGDSQITNEPEYLQQCKRMCDSYLDGESKRGSLEVAKKMEESSFFFSSNKKIKMIGPATRGECVSWFSQAHCMLHPNLRFREPLGLAPLEAQACGCPVIAFDYGAMRETIVPGETGYLIRTRDEKTAATELVECAKTFNGLSEGEQRTMRQCCRDWVLEEFPLSKMITRYEALCEEALAGGW